jgi:hypothetical protein
MRSKKLMALFVIGVEDVLRGVYVKTFFIAAVLVLGFTLVSDAQQRPDNDEDGIPFTATAVRIEVNSTDGDAGFQIEFDAEPWTNVRVEGPDGRVVYSVANRSRLRRLGSTENFMESNEPNFEDVPLPDILKLLPAGEYEFEGQTIDGEELDGAAILTHDLPCGPEITFPEEDDILDPGDPVVAAWNPVTSKLDTTTGECDDSTDIEIIGYQIVVDIVDSNPKQRFDIKVPANVTVVTVPPEFIAPGSEYTVEVLAIEASGNQTITESGFLTSN